jgi:hypothetical protein
MAGNTHRCAPPAYTHPPHDIPDRGPAGGILAKGSGLAEALAGGHLGPDLAYEGVCGAGPDDAELELLLAELHTLEQV